MSEDNKTILYKCPYCVSGRFTAEDGWAGAVRHIKENHIGRKKKKKTKAKRRCKRASDVLLEEEEVCYPEEDLAMLPA